MSERPFGSYDWNGNGEYDFFDKVTDQYVYDKVSKYEPEQKSVKYQRPSYSNDDDVSDLPFWAKALAYIVAFLLNPVILIGIIGGILKVLISP